MNKYTIYYILIFIYTCFTGVAQTLLDPLNSVINNRFIGWTDEDYRVYEDSVFASLYPPVIAQKNGYCYIGKSG